MSATDNPLYSHPLDVFTASNFEIAIVAALIGYLLFEFLRERF